MIVSLCYTKQKMSPTLPSSEIHQKHVIIDTQDDLPEEHCKAAEKCRKALEANEPNDYLALTRLHHNDQAYRSACPP